MEAHLNLTLKLLAFSDGAISSNPRFRQADWLRDIPAAPVADPRMQSYTLAVGETKTIFDGTQATAIDGTTSFSLALLDLDPASRYRITHIAGTAPGFRTGRSLTANGMVLTWTVNANGSMTLGSSAPLFGSVVLGDEVFVPNAITGDPVNVISVSNSGYWTVLSVTSSTEIILARPTGQSFDGASETVTITSNSQIRAYTAAGVQVGDTLDITLGFSTAARKSYEVVAVTDAFVEISSTLPLPDQTSIEPTAAGMTFYTDAKRVLYLEADQECVARTNGDTTDLNRVSPFDPADSTRPGIHLVTGPVWSLVVVNRAPAVLNILVFTAG